MNARSDGQGYHEVMLMIRAPGANIKIKNK